MPKCDIGISYRYFYMDFVVIIVCVITKANNGNKMYVPRGKRLGSAGCIDLTSGNDSFYKDYQNYNGTLPLTVKYPKGW